MFREIYATLCLMKLTPGGKHKICFINLDLVGEESTESRREFRGSDPARENSVQSDDVSRRCRRRRRRFGRRHFVRRQARELQEVRRRRSDQILVRQ